MEDAGTSEEDDDIDSQDSNSPIDHCEPLQQTHLHRPLLKMSPTAGDETSRGRTLRMEDARTSEEDDDIDSQDSNALIDHDHLARNCSIKIITLAVKASVISEIRLPENNMHTKAIFCTKVSHSINTNIVEHHSNMEREKKHLLSNPQTILYVKKKSPGMTITGTQTRAWQAYDLLATVPKTYFFQVKRVLYYTSGGDSDTQDILLCGEVVGSRHAVNLHQVAAT